MATIDRVLYLGNATQRRYTSATVSVPRIFGKVALEEHVGTSIWAKYNLTPPANAVVGVLNRPPTLPNTLDTIARLDDINGRLSSMNHSGIGYVIVSLSSPGIQGVHDTALAIKFSTDINDELYLKYANAYPDKFAFFATVPMQDPVAAASELERAVSLLGAKGAAINGYTDIGPPGNSTTRYLDDPINAPFWSKVAALNVPIYLHPRAPPPSQQLVYNYPNNSLSAYPGLVTGGFAYGAETAVHALRLMLSGLFDTHPNIQIILGHAAEGLPFLIHRSDTQLAAEVPGTNGPYKRPLRYYLRNNFYATLSGVRRLSTTQCTLAEMGEERVLFSVDYPFQSNEDAADWFDGVEGMSVETKRKVVRGNARRLFNLTVDLDERQIDGDFM
ncbi:Amidohydrolase [Pyrenophora tritici-repentis]|nr:Amidohydrolase [Pyrenophora tritici-repentis]